MSLENGEHKRWKLGALFFCSSGVMAGNVQPITASVVSIPLSTLQDKDADISKELEEGFGPGGLGIIAVSEVPDYATLRRQLLYLADRLATLPESVRENLEDPDSRYSFGWSHGKENLESGQPDVLKGSFYANPIVDMPTFDQALLQRYPSFCRPNKWPTKDLPELEQAFKDLGKLLVDVGMLLAYHCDKYVASMYPDVKSENLEEILRNSQYHKGRLLHYFPPATRVAGWMSRPKICYNLNQCGGQRCHKNVIVQIACPGRLFLFHLVNDVRTHHAVCWWGASD